MTAPHHHIVLSSRGLASVEHEHPGPDRRHVHEGQPELGPSTSEDAILARLKAMARRAGKPLRLPRDS